MQNLKTIQNKFFTTTRVFHIKLKLKTVKLLIVPIRYVRFLFTAKTDRTLVTEKRL